jgi:hypothetical protein
LIDIMKFSFAPLTLDAYRQRLLTGRVVALVLVIALLVGTELHFSWLEGAAGNYLLSTNVNRPESGAIWEQGHQSESARRALDQQLNRRQDVQREVRQAVSMGQVIGGLAEGGGAMVSADHFLELYRKLPPILAHELASPYTLLAHRSSGRWRRAFFERRNAALAIYLLDSHSQVLLRIDLGPDLVEHIRRGEVAIQVGLDQLSDFSGAIYSAEHFFTVLNTMSSEVRENVVAQPADLLQVSGKITRVGISSISMAGSVDLGFEVEDTNGVKVILTQGRSTAVLRLKWALERWTSSRSPMVKEPGR